MGLDLVLNMRNPYTGIPRPIILSSVILEDKSFFLSPTTNRLITPPITMHTLQGSNISIIHCRGIRWAALSGVIYSLGAHCVFVFLPDIPDELVMLGIVGGADVVLFWWDGNTVQIPEVYQNLHIYFQ